MIINVYPSQNNPTNQTIWIFSGSSTTQSANQHLRTSGNYDDHDSWDVNGNLFNANEPNRQTISLSPLFSSTNAIDIESVRKRIPGGARTQAFAANATNTPTITIGSGSRTIANLWMSENGSEDSLGIRVSGSNLSYSTGQSSAWRGSGILNKPIGDFFTGTFNHFSGGFFAGTGAGLRVVVNSQVIPEPEEYALVFGLFALGFVLLRRYWQKKKRQQAATSQ